MHHHSRNRERTLNLSILILSGSGKVPRVESNYTARSTSCGAIPSISLSFTLANVLPPE
eukprot:gene12780-gene10329